MIITTCGLWAIFFANAAHSTRTTSMWQCHQTICLSIVVWPRETTHDSDVGLRCSSCSLYLCGDGECTTATACDGVVECQDGSDETCGGKTYLFVREVENQ